jgi:hypothetical protein
MRLPCSQCQKILFLGSFYEIVYNENGIHMLCRKECKDKWVSDVAPVHDSGYICAQCKKVLEKLEPPVEFWSYTESEYFCSQLCRDKWLQRLPEAQQFDCPPIDHLQPQESSNEGVQDDEPRLRTVQ